MRLPNTTLRERFRKSLPAVACVASNACCSSLSNRFFRSFFSFEVWPKATRAWSDMSWRAPRDCMRAARCSSCCRLRLWICVDERPASNE